MASDTLAGYIARCRKYLHEYNRDTSFWKDAVITQMFNMSYRRFCTDLVVAHEGYFTNVVECPIVANQSYYTWPEGFERLNKLEIVRSDGATQPLRRQERAEQVAVAPVPAGSLYLPTYRPIGGGFLIEPACSEGSLAKTVLLSFDELDPSITAVGDGSVSLITSNIKEGAAAYLVDKAALPAATFGFLQDVDLDFSNYTDAKIWIYLPSVSLAHGIPQISIELGDVTGGNYYRWTFTTVTDQALVAGWNEIQLDFTDPSTVVGTGWDDTNVDELRINFVNAAGAAYYFGGCIVDSLETPFTTGASEAGSLRLEYYGTPTLLEVDTDRLHPDFPVTFDEMLVIATVVAAMRAESMLENGPPRAMAQQLLEMEEQWLRYIDGRMTSKQAVQPFLGPYEDA